MIEASMLKTDSVRVITISEATRYCIPGIVPPHHYLYNRPRMFLSRIKQLDQASNQRELRLKQKHRQDPPIPEPVSQWPLVACYRLNPE